MRIKLFAIVLASLGIVLGFYLAPLFSVAPIVVLASAHTPEATQPATDTMQSEATATALIAQFKLSKVYQDSLFTVSYPEKWATQVGSNALALVSDEQVIGLIEKIGQPKLAPGQIAIEIMNGVIGAKIKPGVSNIIVNVNCTSCHVLGDSTTLKPSSVMQRPSQISPSPADVAKSIVREYRGAPLNYTFGEVQPFLLGTVEGVEATFTARPNDGMLIVFYSNEQLVNVLVSVPSGELPKDQPLIEAIVSTIQETRADTATPTATDTDHN